ncbi:hypothetical protein PR202_gb19014 [Eleusine coracana subsp. coracana]|uniref:Hexosyltransferase n=1 Tax=Eleusine coracana subsp. coracana TaxID=191504 RepID=A0AAV5F765_ELECO|nr:hypothetical protein PR202_gb19014 [Eleusine coracana subsp. coracana]
MRSITISSSNGIVDSMKVRVAPQPPPPPPPLAGRRGGGGGGGGGSWWGSGWYWRAVAFPAVIALGCLLPFAFILAAVPALEAGGSKCSSIGLELPLKTLMLLMFQVDCLGRRIGPSFLGRQGDDSTRLVQDLYRIFDQVNNQEFPSDTKLPESFRDFLLEMKDNHYDARMFAVRLKATLFPNLDKVVFLDDDIVVQRDLSPLWEINLEGKVNGAVETCRGEDSWVMSKRFRTYFNFSHPIIARSLDPDECAWAYGMNIFDLAAWRKTNIRDTYHFWLKENLKSGLTLWKFGTLPPALVAFRGHVHGLDPSWHMLGLGYQEKTDVERARRAAVIHYNGQCKPWLDIAFKNLQPFWTKYVNYSNDFVRNCHILEPQYGKE